MPTNLGVKFGDAIFFWGGGAATLEKQGENSREKIAQEIR